MQAKHISEFIDQIRGYEEKRIVVKVGGGPIQKNQSFLPSLSSQLRFLQRFNAKIILVHGGGAQIAEELKKHNIKRYRHPSGHWRTPKEHIPHVKKALGEVNKKVTFALTQEGCKAFAASADETCPIYATPYSANQNDFTGIATGTYLDPIHTALQKGQIYVTHSMGINLKTNDLYNVNADDAAVTLSAAIEANRLLLATDINGVLDKEGQTISELSPEKVERLKKDGTIVDGMAVKIDSTVHALKRGVGGVAIINGNKPNSILVELGSRAGGGTLIKHPYRNIHTL